MKKIISLALCALMLVTVLAACGNETPADNTPATLKFGMGVFVSPATVADATEDKAGSASMDATYAAVSVDADGKIVGIALDVMQHKLSFTADGKAAVVNEFKSKYEKMGDYNMKPASPIGKEWNEQAAAFDTVCTGKTIAEITALVVDGKGNDEVVNAGCTMKLGDWIEVYAKF